MPNKHEEFVLGGTDKLENHQKELEKLQRRKEEYEEAGKKVPEKLEKDIRILDGQVEKMMEEALIQVEEKKEEGELTEDLSPEEQKAIKNILKEEEEKTRKEQ